MKTLPEDRIGIMTESEGRHFCLICSKLIRIGEGYSVYKYEKPLRREMGYSYSHNPKCNRGNLQGL